jgi:2-C-methyl-D-erythritol 4-phosphate cytidylyltransferase
MADVDKIMAPLLGRSLIAHSLRVFDECPLVARIVLVVSTGNIQACLRIVAEGGFRKVVKVRAGGERRQDSVRNGLEELTSSEWVIVHDGARPCLDAALIEAGLAEARETGAAAAAVPVTDTIKRTGSDRMVAETLDRDSLWAVQTPQIFRTEVLVAAHQQVTDDATDDASMVERCGRRVRLFMGSYDNIKVTTPEDMRMAEFIMRATGRGVAGLAE